MLEAMLKSMASARLTMPVDGSTVRESVSTAMTCLQDSFHGPYFCQFDVETSSHE